MSIPKQKFIPSLGSERVLGRAKSGAAAATLLFNVIQTLYNQILDYNSR